MGELPSARVVEHYLLAAKLIEKDQADAHDHVNPRGDEYGEECQFCNPPDFHGSDWYREQFQAMGPAKCKAVLEQLLRGSPGLTWKSASPAGSSGGSSSAPKRSWDLKGPLAKAQGRHGRQAVAAPFFTKRSHAEEPWMGETPGRGSMATSVAESHSQGDVARILQGIGRYVPGKGIYLPEHGRYVSNMCSETREAPRLTDSQLYSLFD